MSTLFISHSSSDNEAAIELEQRLARQGHDCVFLDLDPEKGIVAGKSWERTLYRKIRACRAVIALCTDNYLNSHWCFAELALARMEGKHLFALKLEPLSEQARLPSILTEKQYVDLRDDPETGYQRLWRGLTELELLGVATDWDPKDAPYLGLSAYQEKHAPVFFGREEEAREGVELLDRGAPGLIMTLGASGSGKSSLVRAGIIPRLRRDFDRWIVVEPFRPRNNPFLELADALAQTYRRYAPESAGRKGDREQLYEQLRSWSPAVDSEDGQAEPLTSDERVQRLVKQLEDLHQAPPDSAENSFLNFLDWSIEDLRRICDGPGAPGSEATPSGATLLTELARDLQKVCDRQDARVLIVVDQFEELLDTDESARDKRAFLAMLRSTVESDNSPLMVLATMRTDFLATFQNNEQLRGIDFESLSVGPVKHSSMRKIIESPAKMAAIELQEGLSDRLLEDTHRNDALPLLSFTLWVLWRDYSDDGVIELHEYEELDGLHGAIAREADALLGETDETALRNAFLRMTRITEEGNYARRAANWESEDLKPVHPLLERFIERRLLVTTKEGDTRTIEVAHEALYHCWQPLNSWLNDYRAELLLNQEISRDTQTWESNQRSSDILWRGARLQQARQLLNNGKLTGQEKDFVSKSARRQNLRNITLGGIGIAVFAGMAWLTFKAENEKKIAQTAQRALYGEFTNLLIVLANPPFLEVALPEGVPSQIEVLDETRFKLEQSDSWQQNDAKVIVIGNVVDGGKAILVGHDGLLNTTSTSLPFLKNSIRYVSGNADPATTRLLYSTGHCEVATWNTGVQGKDLPVDTIAGWGYSIEPIENLTKLQSEVSGHVLIVANAWSSFTPAELDAVEQFVKSGGALLLSGLYWSWNGYKHESSGFNPCTWAADSTGHVVAQDSYPMNDLVERFGLAWK